MTDLSPTDLSTRTLRTMLPNIQENQPQPVAISDLKGTSFLVNAPLAGLLELPSAGRIDAPGETKFIRDLLRMSRRSIREELLNRGGIASVRTELVRSDGSDIPMLIHGTVVEEKPNGNHMVAWVFAPEEEWTDACVKILPASDEDCALSVECVEPGVPYCEAARAGERDCCGCMDKTRDAVNLLIHKMHEQKRELLESLSQNYSLTVLPILEHLKAECESDPQAHLLDALEFNIRHINSIFGITQDIACHRLSSREMEICQMIRAGKDSRQIALALGLKFQTVMVHRKNIRKKLGLKRSGARLSAFLAASSQED